MRGRLMRVPRATQQPHTLFSCISARLRGCCRRAAILRGQRLSQWHSVSIASTAPSRAAVGRVCEGDRAHTVSRKHDSAQRAGL